MKISKFLHDFLNNMANNRYFSAVGYLPFVGWLIPLYLKKDDANCQYHGKQGLLLSTAFLSLILALFFLIFLFIPSNWRIFKFGMVIIIYVIYGVYFSLCISGIYASLKGKKLEIPFISNYISYIKL